MGLNFKLGTWKGQVQNWFRFLDINFNSEFVRKFRGGFKAAFSQLVLHAFFLSRSFPGRCFVVNF